MSLRFRIRPALLLLTAAGALAATPEFHLPDTAGALHTPAEWRAHKAAVLFFVTTDCPVANSYVPEMNRLRQAYSPRGVLFWAVQTDVSTPTADAARYHHEYAYSFPLLLDPAQVLVSLAGATITPQAAVIAPDGRVAYLGRIDNRVVDFGQQRLRATVFDLRDALDAVLAGKPVAHPRTKSIGCAITRAATPAP